MEDDLLAHVPEDSGGMNPPPKTIEVDHVAWVELEEFKADLERGLEMVLSHSFAIREALKRARGTL